MARKLVTENFDKIAQSGHTGVALSFHPKMKEQTFEVFSVVPIPLPHDKKQKFLFTEVKIDYEPMAEMLQFRSRHYQAGNVPRAVVILGRYRTSRA